MRVIVRRERPHPGAQLDVFEERDGYRYQAMATNTTVGPLAFLEARLRAHARVEDRIRQIQDAGLGRLPSRWFTINIRRDSLGESLGMLGALRKGGTRTLIAPRWDVVAADVGSAFASMSAGICAGESLADALDGACREAAKSAPTWLAWSIALEGDWR